MLGMSIPGYGCPKGKTVGRTDLPKVRISKTIKSFNFINAAPAQWGPEGLALRGLVVSTGEILANTSALSWTRRLSTIQPLNLKGSHNVRIQTNSA